MRRRCSRALAASSFSSSSSGERAARDRGCAPSGDRPGPAWAAPDSPSPRSARRGVGRRPRGPRARREASAPPHPPFVELTTRRLQARAFCATIPFVVHQDNVLRAITDDGAFRVIAADTTATVRGAIEAQRPETLDLVRTFADLLTGAVLVRESMAPDNRLQAILQGDNPRARMIADTHPDGATRGLIQLPQDVKELTYGTGGLLQVARTLHNGSLHQGVVRVPADSKTLSAGFMAYMQESEQTTTMIAIGAHLANGEVVSAGGYMVQLLPEVAEGPLAVMTERLKDFEDIVPLLARGGASPSELLRETLYGMPYTTVGDRSVHFGCRCSPDRLALSLASLPRADIESLMVDGKTLEIECDYCRTKYEFTQQQLRSLIDNN
ncbi:MAG: Hsp33 family molecular chaperone HslO [Deltaproteobacteria bacterium]|nr:Hsp33 family molecular chaperone HslO [Deltaproteobacteria bacterium]